MAKEYDVRIRDHATSAVNGMPRPVLSVTLSLGLVSIPVRLYAATVSKRVAFHFLDPTTGRRVRQQFVSAIPSTHGEEHEAGVPSAEVAGARARGAGTPPSAPVPPDAPEREDWEPPDETRIVPRQQLVKGYEISREEHVELTPDELKALEAEANEQADIEEFVPMTRIDPVYYDKAYYLGPAKGGEKVYRLFARTLHEQQRAAVTKVVMRGKEKLAVVRPAGGERLVLETLHYADEVRDLSEIPLPEAALSEAEVRLAGQVIASRAVDEWQPERYRDTYRERVLALIEEKRRGRPRRARTTEASAPVVDLMEALRRSLTTPQKRPARSVAISPAASRPKGNVKRTG